MSRKARFVITSAGECLEKPTRVNDDRATQSSRSLNSSDSSPSFASVDSKSNVEGSRRPVYYREATTRRPFRTSSEAECPAALARFKARTSSAFNRTVAEIMRAIQQNKRTRNSRKGLSAIPQSTAKGQRRCLITCVFESNCRQKRFGWPFSRPRGLRDSCKTGVRCALAPLTR